MKKQARLEKTEENKFVKKVESRSGEAIKLQTQGPYGKGGYNDRLVLMPGRVIVLFEFKRQGKSATQRQNYRHRRFKKMGIPCYVVYTSAEAIQILDQEIRSQAIPEGGDKVRNITAFSRVLLSTGAGEDDHNPDDLLDTEEARRRRAAISSNKTPDRI